MAGFEITINQEQMKGIEKMLGGLKSYAPKVAVGAINKTGAKGQTRIRRRFAAEMGAPLKYFKASVKFLKANPETMTGRIRMKNFRVPMIATRKTPTLGGTYSLNQKGEPQQIQHTPFKQKMISGHMGWFVRTDPKRAMAKGRYAGKIRQPVKQIYADSPASLWENAPGIAAQEMEAVAEDLERQIASQIDRYLAQ